MCGWSLQKCTCLEWDNTCNNQQFLDNENNANNENVLKNSYLVN